MLPKLNPKLFTEVTDKKLKEEFMKGVMKINRGVIYRSGSRYKCSDIRLFKNNERDNYMVQMIDEKKGPYAWMSYSKDK